MAGVEGLGGGSGTGLHPQIFEGICEQRLMSSGKTLLSTGPVWAQEAPEFTRIAGHHEVVSSFLVLIPFQLIPFGMRVEQQEAVGSRGTDRSSLLAM